MTNIATKALPKHVPPAIFTNTHNNFRERPLAPSPRLESLAHPPANLTMVCDVAWNSCPIAKLLCGAPEGAGGEEIAAGSVLPFTVHTIPARRLILHPKEWSDFLPVIVEGWAMSSVALPDGRRQVTSFLLPGDIVSAASLMAPLSSHTVEAVSEVTYRKLRRDDVKRALFGRPELLERLFGLWSEAKSRGDQLALDLGRRRADERIARLILRLAEKVAKRAPMRTQALDFPLRQRHIADATGLTPVHVSKVLGELQRAGLLEISGRELTIRDLPELQRVADWR